MYRFIAAVMAVASCASIARAQSPEPASISSPLTLQQALTLAGAVAPGVEGAAAGVRAADAGRLVAGYQPNPTVVAETENIGGSGQYRGLRSAETTVGLALPIERGDKRSARMAVADAFGKRARIDSVLALADLRLAITRLYISAIAADRRLITAREQATIAHEVLRVAAVRVQAGRASPLERQRADVLRINADTAVDRAGRLAGVARDNLARRIGRPMIGPLDPAWYERIDDAGAIRPIDPARTLAMAAARADAATAEAQVRLARSQRVPDVTLSASARRLEVTNDVAAVFGVSIPFPVFNNGRAAEAQARALGDQAQASARAAALDAAQDIATVKAEVANAATSARNAAGPALAAATEAARIARIGYREGKFGQLDLLDAERTLLETRNAETDAFATYHDAVARLERLAAAAPSSGDDDR